MGAGRGVGGTMNRICIFSLLEYRKAAHLLHIALPLLCVAECRVVQLVEEFVPYFNQFLYNMERILLPHG